ncbi:probable rhamnogalacturonate lyase B isoform X2 [Salvia splendens]|uniref:probable rhamnogalacturonate lyase B isoform X2 n=1 Tax=Salvia splendens TaxID=180675 RepID=UPI001C273E4D|nr:probable rhamnogalacturonate lyase B isoform X2 [Salvia splendens]
MSKSNVTLSVSGSNIIIDNVLVRLTIMKPQGLLTAIKYAGIDNLLDTKSNQLNRGYWDINWNLPGGQDRYQLLRGSEYSVISLSNDNLEVSFKSSYDPSISGTRLPLTIDQRYIVRSGISGFYCYAIYERPQGCPAFDLVQTRMVFKLQRDRFHYMAITDEKQRVMPMPEDLLPGRGKTLIVPESVLLVNPINPDLKGEVDDKYQYSMENKDGGVHGWISSNPSVGFWIIFPSHEFRNGGPTKQNLTCHTGPTCLAMLHGSHYIGNDMVAHFEQGEVWRKVFGPFFVYLNATKDVSQSYNLWTDAKKQTVMEESLWPYDFISSPYYLTSKERGSATGRLFVQDRYISDSLIPAKSAFVGLSVATTPGSWQTESKDYQFWVQTDLDGNFSIKNVVPGVYGVHGWVPGVIGDYLYHQLVTISQGLETEVGDVIYVPIRDGPTVWEIGYPDRTAATYYVPDVNPIYVNKLFVNTPEKYRQYGLWDRYTDLNPKNDQIFTIGVSDARKDWFFAHVDRRNGNNKYVPTTWEIRFYLQSVAAGIYKLRLAIASATRSDLEIHVNQMNGEQLVFQVTNLGGDNAVCRHGIHGLYQLFSVDISSALLIHGDNSMFLTQARAGDALCGILYDYLRLEAPPT